MRKWIPLLVIVVAFVASAAVYQDLPDRMPTHWNMSGEVDGWTSLPWGAFLIPVMLVVMLVVFHLLPKIDPRAPSYAKFRGSYEIVIVAMMLFLLGVHLVILASALGMNIGHAGSCRPAVHRHRQPPSPDASELVHRRPDAVDAFE